jgi:outer membrane murein-binding lipoprotein Lpp
LDDLDEVQLSTLTIQKNQWEDSSPKNAVGYVDGLFSTMDTLSTRAVSILLLPVDNATRVESRSIGIEVTNVTPMTGIGDVTIFFSREGDAPTMDLKYVVIAFSEPNETGEAFTVSAGFVGIGASSTDQLEADVEALKEDVEDLKQQTGEAITKHDEDIDEIYGELQNLEAIAGTNVQAISDIQEILKGMGGGPNQDEEQNQKLQQLESNYGELKSVVDELLYVPISIDEFKSSVTSAEKGSTVTETTLSWTLNKDPEAVSLDGVALEPLESADYTLRDLAITANKKFTLSATDGKKTVTKDASINFYNGVYYGAATVPEAYNSAFMIALGKSGKKVLRGSKLTSFTVTAGAGEYIYYCLPVSMGACSFKVGGFDGGFDLVATLAYTNEYGHTEQYYIYRSANAGLGETNVEVK